MGNQFSYYLGNEQFRITTIDDIFAFVIYNSNISKSDMIINTDWESVEFDNGNDTYNILFRYKPDGIYTVASFNDLKIFTVTIGTLDISLTIHWVNDTNNIGIVSSNPSFSNTEPLHWDQEGINSFIGSGGGDPEINPVINPQNKIYILPTDNYIYQYFNDNNGFFINAKMQVLSNKYIEYLEQLQKCKSPNYHLLKYNIIINDNNIQPLDTSFIKYISIIYINKLLIFCCTAAIHINSV